MAKESEEKEYTIMSLICELNKVVDAHGDLPVYIFDEYRRVDGKNMLNGFEVYRKESVSPFRPKRVEFF
jgi:hypothetical protein